MMADRLSVESRSRIMRAIRDKNTKPEKIVRRLLFSEGYRYRLNYKRLPGKPDLAFPSRRKVILVHGCFWHQHSAKNCPIRVVPSTNEDYWTPKLLRNRARDTENIEALQALGWRSLVVWECDLRLNLKASFRRMKRFLGPPGNAFS